jgi:hypothetical protein
MGRSQARPWTRSTRFSVDLFCRKDRAMLFAVATFALANKELRKAVHVDLTARETLLKEREKAALAKFTGWKRELEAREAALEERENKSNVKR